MHKYVAAAALVVAMSGCTALGGLQSAITPTSTAVVLGAVDLALGQFVFNNPATNQIKAVAVKTIADQIVADSANPTATVATIEATINKRIMALNPADAAAFIAFTGQLQLILDKTAAAPGAAVTSTTLVAIGGVAKEVSRVASLYLG